MIAFSCECGKRYEVKDELAGKRAKCACGKTLLVPQPVAAPPVPPPLPVVVQTTPPPPPVDEQSERRSRSARWPLIASAIAAVLVVGTLSVWLMNSGVSSTAQNTQPVSADTPRQATTATVEASDKKSSPNELQSDEVAIDWRTDPKGLEVA